MLPIFPDCVRDKSDQIKVLGDFLVILADVGGERF